MNTEIDTEEASTEIEADFSEEKTLDEFPEVEAHEDNSSLGISSSKVGGFIPLQRGLTPGGAMTGAVRFDLRTDALSPFSTTGIHHNQRSIVQEVDLGSKPIISNAPATTKQPFSRKEAGMTSKWTDSHAPVQRTPSLGVHRPVTHKTSEGGEGDRQEIPRALRPRKKVGGRRKATLQVPEILTPEERRKRQLLIAEAQAKLEQELLNKQVMKIETATEGLVGLLETSKASDEIKKRIRKCVNALYKAFYKPDV